MELHAEYRSQSKYIASVYKEDGINIDPLFVVGCFYRLYAIGHSDDGIRHEYTHERICYMIDERLDEVKTDIHNYCYVPHEDSAMSVDVLMEDDGDEEIINEYMETLPDKIYIKLIRSIISDAYKNGAYHTRDIIYVLRDVDIKKYCLDAFPLPE